MTIEQPHFSCFISYSHSDEDFAKCLYDRLRAENVVVWYAPEAMSGGKKIHEQIEDAVNRHDKLLLVLSEKSMSSEWVQTEIYHATQRAKKENTRTLFPIRLVSFEKIRDWRAFNADIGKDMAREVREYFVPDFSDWRIHKTFDHAIQRLLRDLEASSISR